MLGLELREEDFQPKGELEYEGSERWGEAWWEFKRDEEHLNEEQSDKECYTISS